MLIWFLVSACCSASTKSWWIPLDIDFILKNKRDLFKRKNFCRDKVEVVGGEVVRQRFHIVLANILHYAKRCVCLSVLMVQPLMVGDVRGGQKQCISAVMWGPSCKKKTALTVYPSGLNSMSMTATWYIWLQLDRYDCNLYFCLDLLYRAFLWHV